MLERFPTPQPTLTTARLILRPFTLADAPDVERHVSMREIAEMTLSIPHPYPEGDAAGWIGTRAASYAEGQNVNFAITLRDGGTLVGSIGLVAEPEHHRAELGYWIGKAYWGRGYATEAAEAVVGFGFETLGLNKIHAAHFIKNPSSGRVLEKLGMTYEGCLREHDYKWGVYEDIKVYAVLAREWAARRSA
jgi:[ribosomal protein S5]-alanine N-acetyltransferase